MKKSVKRLEMQDGRVRVYHNGVIVEYERVNNDYYGNPLYRIYPVSTEFVHSKVAYRNYTKVLHPYWLVQSYGILSDVSMIIDDIQPQVMSIEEPGGYKMVEFV